jgi:hypothetical protein
MTWESLRMKKIIFHRLIRKVITLLVGKVIMAQSGRSNGNSSQYIHPEHGGDKIVHFRFHTARIPSVSPVTLLVNSHMSRDGGRLLEKQTRARLLPFPFKLQTPLRLRESLLGALKKLNLTPLSSR